MKLLLFLYLTTILLSCRNSPEENYQYRNSSDAHDVKTNTSEGIRKHVESNINPDMLKGGDGITIGNGYSESDSEFIKPVTFVGNDFSCEIINPNTAYCHSKTPIDDSFLDKIQFIDQSGSKIPPEQLKIDFRSTNELFEMIISAPLIYRISQIVAIP